MVRVLGEDPLEARDGLVSLPVAQVDGGLGEELVRVAFGQRLDLGSSGRVDIQVQGGSDLAFVTTDTGDSLFDPRVVGGANVTFVPAPTVRIYMETSTTMKALGWEQGGSFRFNVLTFGIKIIGRQESGDPQYEIGAGASAPYTTNYWGYHVGSVTGDLNYFL